MALIFNSALGDVAVAIATLLVVLYLYLSNASRYWKKRGVHYVKPMFFFDDIILEHVHLAVHLKSVYNANVGHKFVGIFVKRSPILVVHDLEVLRNIMVKDAHVFLDRPIDPVDHDPLFSKCLFTIKGNDWRNMRVKLTPAFTSGKIKNMFYLVNECGKQLVTCIEKEMTKGRCEVKDTVARYSTHVIASCAFGMNANALTHPTSEFRTFTWKILEKTGFQKFIASIFTYMPWMINLLGLDVFDGGSTNYIRKTFWDVVDSRKNIYVVRKDFVDILMQLKNEGQVRAEDAKDIEEIKQDSIFTDVKHLKSGISENKLDDDIVAQAFVFIAAGLKTSSSVITFALYELAQNPDIQDKLRNEINNVLEKHNSEVTYDAISEMYYLDLVMSETMRKYPTLPVLARKCLSDYKIPGTDVTIEKGTSVYIPVLAIHLDPVIYPEPDKFDPERFNPENKIKRPNIAYMPFGEGPRNCIGMRFGQIQVKTALVHTLMTYTITTNYSTPGPPLNMKPDSTVNVPYGGIYLVFQKIY